MGGRLIDVFPALGWGSKWAQALRAGVEEIRHTGHRLTTATLADEERGPGNSRFEFKASGDPVVDIEMARFVGEHMRAGDSLIIDANAGWRVDEAIRVAEATTDINVIFEQPCYTYEECRAFKDSTGRRVSLDECIHDIADLVRAHGDRAIDVLNLKIGRIGGLTKSRQLRDVCVALGIPLKIQDTSGEEFNAAATAHLAHSTPPRFMLSLWDCANMVTKQIGTGLVRSPDEQVRANTEPGFGVEPIMDALGEPVAVYE